MSTFSTEGRPLRLPVATQSYLGGTLPEAPTNAIKRKARWTLHSGGKAGVNLSHFCFGCYWSATLRACPTHQDWLCKPKLLSLLIDPCRRRLSKPQVGHKGLLILLRWNLPLNHSQDLLIRLRRYIWRKHNQHSPNPLCLGLAHDGGIH